MNTKIVAKRALLYAFIVIVIGFTMSSINYLSTLITTHSPTFPLWILPFLSSLIVVPVGIFVWNKIRETDRLKYEFINVITHKFRTPLTHIKWEVENLQNSSLTKDDTASIERIRSSNKHLVELTDLLVSLSDNESESTHYNPEETDIAELVRGIAADYKTKCAQKNVSFDSEISDVPLYISIDRGRIKLVLQILLDNALTYAKLNGKINLRVNVGTNTLSINVTDNGIGISKDDLSLIFSRFFRSSKAKSADTEGMGIGLFMAQTIIKKHRGLIKASSPGENKGSTFEIILPLS